MHYDCAVEGLQATQLTAAAPVVAGWPCAGGAAAVSLIGPPGRPRWQQKQQQRPRPPLKRHRR